MQTTYISAAVTSRDSQNLYPESSAPLCEMWFIVPQNFLKCPLRRIAYAWA